MRLSFLLFPPASPTFFFFYPSIAAQHPNDQTERSNLPRVLSPLRFEVNLTHPTRVRAGCLLDRLPKDIISISVKRANFFIMMILEGVITLDCGGCFTCIGRFFPLQVDPGNFRQARRYLHIWEGQINQSLAPRRKWRQKNRSPAFFESLQVVWLEESMPMHGFYYSPAANDQRFSQGTSCGRLSRR